MTDAVMEVDAAWRITFLDERAEEILGVAAETVLGENLWVPFGGETDPRFADTYRTAMTDRSTEQITAYHAPIDAWLEVVAYPEFHGGLSFYFRDVTERKVHEEQLERAQERIEFALDVTDATVWEWEFITDSITTHPRIHTGIDANVTTIEEFLDAIHPADRPSVRDALRTAIDAGESYLIEYRVPSDDGLRWLEDHGEVRNRDGTPIGMTGTARDITEQKRRELTLQERVKELNALHHMREIFDRPDRSVHALLTDVVAFLPASFRYPDRTEVKLVYGDEQVTTDGFQETDDRIHAERHTTAGPRLRVEVGLDGDTTRGFIDQERDLIDSITAFLREYFDRAEQTHDRETARQRYETILTHLSDFVMIVDEHAAISYVSPAIERVTGYEPADVIGTSAFEYVHESDREIAAEAFANIVTESSEEVTVEYRIEAADGSVRWVEARGRNYRGEPLIGGILVSVRDVTVRRGQEERFAALVEESSDLLTVVDDARRMRY